MDLSKLPKLSTSEAPPPQETPAPQMQVPQARYATSPVYTGRPSGDALVGFLIALILVAINPRPLAFIRNRLTGHSFDYQFSDEQGAPLAYTSSVFFIGDAAILIFAIALLMESVVLTIRPTRPFVLIAFVVTLIAMGVNLFYVVWMYNTYGLQLISTMIVVCGIYTASSQWRFLQSTRPSLTADELLR